MAKLTTKRRNSLPDAKFAGPDRSYPVDTRHRAANAKARATQAVNAGRMSKSTEAKIDAKANKVLGEGKMEKKTATHHHTQAKHHMKMAHHHMEQAHKAHKEHKAPEKHHVARKTEHKTAHKK